MSPLFMDTGYDPNSPCSLSAEESGSNKTGSEKEGEGQQLGKRGTKRQEKNRDAARKSRKKQTERADELHEELQSLERSNSALKKEIALLEKDFHHYTKVLERHEPFCCLRVSGSTSILSVPSSTATSSPPPAAPPQASASTQAPAPSHSTSLASSLGFQALDCAESSHLSTSAPARTSTTLASSASSSSEPFICSTAVDVPYSVSFSTVSAPHSLFSQDPPPRLTNVTPAQTGLISNPPPSRQGAIDEPSSMSANTFFSTHQPGATDAFLMKYPSFLSNVPPAYSAAENAGCPMNMPQLHPRRFTTNPINSASPCPTLPPTQQHNSLLTSNSEPSPASIFAPRQPPPSPASLLSLLTVPSPLSASQTTSSQSSFDGPTSQSQSSLQPLGEPLGDLSLSALLECNEWILQCSGANK